MLQSKAPYGPAQGYLYTAALAAFAIAQPLYDLIGRNPAFLTAHFAQPIDIALIVLGVSIMIPALLITVQFIAAQLNRRLWLATHSVIICLLAAAAALPLLAKLAPLPDAVVITFAAVIGFAFFLLLHRNRSLQFITRIASLGVVLFPLLFVLRPSVFVFASPPANPMQLPSVAATAPVVLLVLDELPTTSLLNANREIDAQRYPNFARLAKQAWWFRNATTVSDDTVSGAVPAIVTGIYPEQPRLYRESAHSLFTLLGGSYGMNVFETYTRVCPVTLCPARQLPQERVQLLFSDLRVVLAHILLPAGMRASLPDISQGWKNFDSQRLSEREQRAQRLASLWDSRENWVNAFIDGFARSEKPQLHFLHVLLPHLPWNFLPNGNQYTLEARGLYGVPGVQKERWGDNHWAIQQGYQRHLLQLGYVDRLLGNMLDKLQDLGLYDDALIVVTADHGVSFRTNDARRPLTNTNAADIMRIPLFIKAPGQLRGQISDAPVETVDILPTIADMLSVSIPWKIDGYPALSAQVQQRTTRQIYQQNRRTKGVANSLPIAGFDSLDDGLTEKLRLFGTDANASPAYSLGPYAHLVGTKTDTSVLPVASSTAPAVALANTQTGRGAPWAVTGLLHRRGAAMEAQDLAIVVSDTICSVTRSYINSTTESAFVAFVGPQCNLDIDSHVEVFEIAESKGDIVLSRLQSHDVDPRRNNDA